MSPDTEWNRFAVNLHVAAVDIFINAHFAPASGRILPFQVGEFQLAFAADQFRLGPVGPVAAVAVSAVGDDQIEVLRALQFGFNLYRVVWSFRRDDRCGSDRLWRCHGEQR